MNNKNCFTLVIVGMLGACALRNVDIDASFGSHPEMMTEATAPTLIGQMAKWKQEDLNIFLPFVHSQNLVASNDTSCNLNEEATDFQMARCQTELGYEEETRLLMAMYEN